MDFDEYDYLEKTVQENDDRDSKKKAVKKEEKSYRKREVDDDVSGDEERKSSKRSRGGDHENGRDKDKDKDRDRHHRSSGGGRERDRDGERDRDRDRGSEREKERDRERSSREKEKERERRDRDKEKEKERERGRRERREKDEKERSRRSVSRSDREEKERSQRSVSRSEREEKERSRRSVSRSEREEKERSRRSRSHTDRDREREVREKEREFEMNESRYCAFQLLYPVVYVSDIGSSVALASLFYCGLVDWNYMLYPSYSSKEIQLKLSALEFLFPYVSLIYALYIEFYDAMHVPMAIALSGQLLLGQPVMVKPSEAEKNLVQSTASGGTTGVVGPYGAVDRKLYVGNLHFNMTETHLREIFEPFGPVELVQLPLDIETSQCKGFGFVQFAHLEHAKAAQSLNGKLDIAGRTIKVSSVTDHVGSQEAGAKTADFDDDDGGGLSLNAQSRALLMQKLDRTGTATSIAGSLGVPVLNGSATNQRAVNLPMNGQTTLSAPFLPARVMPTAEPIGNPSECLLLKDMFDPATEMEPDFDVDIKDDVEEECSKYGRVKHIYVEKNSAGFVYLRFETVEAAAAAQRAMHLRWFAGRQISALFMQPQVYAAKFGA
ncbi:hypothetical protein ACLB2K_004248 [Fragaria x ananassa]